ncbi:MAG: hypothetical protein NW201_10705 [Gemmatimonadales bacterium]|nr:hypothetical protein [Gemmatimonadales bacterium]
MRSARLGAPDIAARGPTGLAGAVLLAPARAGDDAWPKGRRLDTADAERLWRAAAAGTLAALRVAWPAADDVHEDVAARRLALAAMGPGLEARPPRQSRVDLVAVAAGVLLVRAAAVQALAALEPLELFTLLHGQPVSAGEVVASAKVAPHLVPEALVARGEALARTEAPLVQVRPYRAFRAGALVLEQASPQALARFEQGAGQKLAALGSVLGPVRVEPSDDADAVARALRAVLEGGAQLVLVGGVSAGDPTSPFFAALDALGGRVVRRGVPAHPGSMIWLAEAAEVPLLGLPQCGMFSEATAADLVLPRLLTGERLDAASLAELAVGGLLGPGMRFRFPRYGEGAG